MKDFIIIITDTNLMETKIEMFGKYNRTDDAIINAISLYFKLYPGTKIYQVNSVLVNETLTDTRTELETLKFVHNWIKLNKKDFQLYLDNISKNFLKALEDYEQ